MTKFTSLITELQDITLFCLSLRLCVSAGKCFLSPAEKNRNENKDQLF
jgi:hypothetical protein